MKHLTFFANRVLTHLSWNFILDLGFWYDKSIYDGFNTVTAVSVMFVNYCRPNVFD